MRFDPGQGDPIQEGAEAIRAAQDRRRTEALAAIGWFYDGPYLTRPEIHGIDAIVALWRDEQ